MVIINIAAINDNKFKYQPWKIAFKYYFSLVNFYSQKS